MSLWRTRFGTLGILRFAVTDALKKKPLRAVYGNIDDAEERRWLQRHR
jgi:hypothetical protein